MSGQFTAMRPPLRARPAPPRHLTLGWLGAGALLLAGCATLPHSQPPATPLSASTLGLQGTAQQPVAAQWWKSLGDPQLDTLIDEAVRGSPRLAEAQARLRTAQAQADAVHAGQLPDLHFSASESRTQIPTGFGPYLLGGHGVWFGNLGAVLSWDPDLWGQRAATREAARDQARAADLDRAEARLLLTGAVVQAYLDLNLAYELEAVASGAQAQRARILEITQRRVGAGLDTRVELREAQGALPQAQLALLQARAAQTLARHELAALTGRGAQAYAAIRQPALNPQATLPLPAALPINLLARRPDVIAARARIDAADAQRRAARAAFYPRINLRALAGFASISFAQLISSTSFGYEAGPALTLPLFDGGRLRANYRGAQGGLDLAVARYDDTVLNAVHQAADQLTLIDALGAELQQQRQWVAAAEEAYRLDEERYRAGLASYLSVLNAETEVLNARRQSVQLDSALASARVSLLVAVGGDFQPAAPALASR
jgi:NodT family efflux transporter outer membrane factor (OMF) lipoprotein